MVPLLNNLTNKVLYLLTIRGIFHNLNFCIPLSFQDCFLQFLIYQNTSKLHKLKEKKKKKQFEKTKCIALWSGLFFFFLLNWRNLNGIVWIILRNAPRECKWGWLRICRYTTRICWWARSDFPAQKKNPLLVVFYDKPWWNWAPKAKTEQKKQNPFGK